MTKKRTRKTTRVGTVHSQRASMTKFVVFLVLAIVVWYGATEGGLWGKSEAAVPGDGTVPPICASFIIALQEGSPPQVFGPGPYAYEWALLGTNRISDIAEHINTLTLKLKTNRKDAELKQILSLLKTKYNYLRSLRKQIQKLQDLYDCDEPRYFGGSDSVGGGVQSSIGGGVR